MARIDPNQGLMPSLVDRLIDPSSGGTAWRRGYGIEQMMEAVRRDLEELLNTRQSTAGLSTDFPEVQNSILGFGLPDLTNLAAHTEEQREEVGRHIEAAVQRFEPRLRNVRAVMIEGSDGKERRIKFRIDAKLCVDPAPEVAFDTVLELMTGHYSVRNNDA
jgi:type VI secretion system protein ImpF